MLKNNKDQPMKWWGWGRSGESPNFSKLKIKPFLDSYIGYPYPWDKICQLQEDEYPALPTSILNDSCIEELRQAGVEICLDELSRITHALGRGFRDLWLAREKKQLISAPDLVVYPITEQELVQIVQIANKHKVMLIAFGGGSNVVGALCKATDERRMCISVDTTKLNKVLEIDETTQCATVEAGVLGDVLEAQLEQKGYHFGHLPDSFYHSTLGGWIATNSSGFQSDGYGGIEDLVVGLELVTPNGVINFKSFPRSSIALDFKRMVFGSEGTLGIISKVKIKIRAKPEVKFFEAFLFPDFKSGIDAVRQIKHAGLPVITIRVLDPARTAAAFALKPPAKNWLAAKLSKAVKWYLANIKSMDLQNSCLFICGFAGNKNVVKSSRRSVHTILKQNGGCALGKGAGNSYFERKYDFPHLRDYLWQYAMVSDISETSTEWSNLYNLYQAGKEAILGAFAKRNLSGILTCHVSHCYRNGASLYFIFAYVNGDKPKWDDYVEVKTAIQDAFIKNGGTSSHHHGLGIEHAPWLEDNHHPQLIKAYHDFKHSLDPADIMNSGKLQTINLSHYDDLSR